ncbi:SCO0930 family lipoprotein [Actinomadura rugatobispora]|uniref:SCO0930 family lipoprotein n=1 Tax=Actinomadura rugatobispora TaxID=1994 RepID=A0ABW1A764_9ACTN|nr:SCO0930 family lipoprotein [Actinomadura rugatobispora]
MEFPRWALPVAAVLTTSGVFLTACGQEPAGTLNSGAGSRQSPAADPSDDPSDPPPAQPATLEAADVERIGRVVTDKEGRTLYRFDKDTARPPASNCTDQACAEAWPPVMTGQGQIEVKGVDENLVGKVRRPDGAWQVTLGGWPLYRFAQDDGPGDVKGQGKSNAWFAAAPDGKKATAPQQAQPDRNEGGGDRWAGWTVVKVRQDPQLGPIVTDGKGRVMYRFDKDRPKTTTCFGACKKAWPVVTFTNWKKLKVEGVDRDLVDFIERRDDGSCQLTINGWPMYYYAEDEQPGDATGQGAQNVWWVVSPQGKKITTDAGGGYGGGY